jgi:hypothetical protein
LRNVKGKDRIRNEKFGEETAILNLLVELEENYLGMTVYMEHMV